MKHDPTLIDENEGQKPADPATFEPGPGIGSVLVATSVPREVPLPDDAFTVQLAPALSPNLTHMTALRQRLELQRNIYQVSLDEIELEIDVVKTKYESTMEVLSRRREDMLRCIHATDRALE